MHHSCMHSQQYTCPQGVEVGLLRALQHSVQLEMSIQEKRPVIKAYSTLFPVRVLFGRDLLKKVAELS